MNCNTSRLRYLLIYNVVLLTLISVTGCYERENKPLREASLVATPDWKRYNISPLCLSGVSYQYIDAVFIGGLTPKYENGNLVSCPKEYKFIGKHGYSYYKLCLDGYWVHNLKMAKGAAYSVALDITGKPLKCDLDWHDFVKPGQTD